MINIVICIVIFALIVKVTKYICTFKHFTICALNDYNLVTEEDDTYTFRSFTNVRHI